MQLREKFTSLILASCAISVLLLLVKLLCVNIVWYLVFSPIILTLLLPIGFIAIMILILCVALIFTPKQKRKNVISHIKRIFKR